MVSAVARDQQPAWKELKLPFPSLRVTRDGIAHKTFWRVAMLFFVP
jgi:hypothetical protein